MENLLALKSRITWEDVIIDEESIATNNAKVLINKELSRVNAEAMQKLNVYSVPSEPLARSN